MAKERSVLGDRAGVHERATPDLDRPGSRDGSDPLLDLRERFVGVFARQKSTVEHQPDSILDRMRRLGPTLD